MKIRQAGFTLIELMLSMSFVAVLLVSVAMLSIQLTNQYTRGITLKEIAQSGTEVTNEVKRTAAQSPLGSTGVKVKNIANGGWVLCTGTYSYIANDPARIEEYMANPSAPNVLKVGTAPGNEVPARFAKVQDLSGAYCATVSELDDSSKKTVIKPDVVELLGGGSRLLVVRALSVTPNGFPATTDPYYSEFLAGRGIYTVTVTIGTGVSSEIESNDSCKAPSDVQSNLEFCAIDSFRFTIRTGGSNG